jgi:hypothetical protein
MSEIQKIAKASTPQPWGMQTFFGYFSQVWFYRIRLNIFWSFDPGEGLHDHAWDFISFPFVSYVEEYLDGVEIKRQVIPRFRFNRKAATHCHRYLGKWSGVGTEVMPGAAWTLCYTAAPRRKWFYVRLHKGKVYRFPWQPYLRRIANLPRLEK